MLRGFWQGAVVVSEPSIRPPGIEAGQHLFEVPLDEVPETLRWLLDSRAGRQRAEEVRAAAAALLRERFDLQRLGRALADHYRGLAA